MQKIEIKRASGSVVFDLVKKIDGKFNTLVIYKNVEPIWGGLYSVALLSKDGCEIKHKRGLCLDAAIEVFNLSKKSLTK